MVSRSGWPQEGTWALRNTRIRVAVRAVALILLGGAVGALETPVDIILDNLGVMFLLALFALGLRVRTLFILAGVFLVGGFALVRAARELVYASYSGELPVIQELWSFHYPALAWLGYILLGLAIGKAAPWRGLALGTLMFWGGIGAVVTLGLGLAARNAFSLLSPWKAWTSMEPHSYSALEMLHNGSVAAFTIGLCVWLSHRATTFVQPLAAAGAMTLTLYVAHLVAIKVVGWEMVFTPSNLAFTVLCLASTLFAVLWRWRLGQGPLERLVSWAARAVGNSFAPRPEQPTHQS